MKSTVEKILCFDLKSLQFTVTSERQLFSLLDSKILTYFVNFLATSIVLGHSPMNIKLYLLLENLCKVSIKIILLSNNGIATLYLIFKMERE